MPAPLMSREEVLGRLLATFRAHGYDGASLSAISEATGLGRSSLYHHFPGGKVEMAREVLAYLDGLLARDVFALLGAAGSPTDKLDGLLRALDGFYEGGRAACLLERLCASVENGAFRRPLARLFATWRGAVEELCLEAGLPADIARSRAEDFVVRIEGALIVAAGTDDLGVFGRTLDGLRAGLLAP